MNHDTHFALSLTLREALEKKRGFALVVVIVCRTQTICVKITIRVQYFKFGVNTLKQRTGKHLVRNIENYRMTLRVKKNLNNNHLLISCCCSSADDQQKITKLHGDTIRR